MPMRIFSGLVVALTVGGLVWSGEDDARSLVAKAIKAAGGAKNLAKHNAATWAEKGTYYGMGEGLPYTAKYAVQWPNQSRMEIQGVFTIVLNGDKGWMKGMDGTKAMGKKELEQQKDELRAGWISSLLPLKDKAFTLKQIEGTKVDGRPAAGVVVTRKGYPEVKLYFDKETGLLVKAAHRAKSAEQGFKEVSQEAYLSDYREVAGAKIPHKVVVKRDGKNFVEAEMSGYEAKGKLPDSVFGEP
jgi:hypothetical protein